MPHSGMFVLLSLLLVSGLSSAKAQSDESVTLQGRIVNEETAMPLLGVHVFLSGTQAGATTNDDGRFRLENIPPGAYRIHVSKLGYQSKSKDTLVTQSKTIDFAMEPQPLEMEEFVVEDERDEDWQSNFERFKRDFIGTSERADSVEVVNREVLSFDRRWWGRLEAEAAEPLIIKNHTLGYRITYFLDEFMTSGTSTKWDGEPLFEELTPENPEQADQWEKEREEAFKGSLRHFLLALINNRVGDEGFALRQYRPDGRGGLESRSHRISTSRIISEDEEEDDVFNFNFFGKLQITYYKGEPSTRYREWVRDHNYRPTGNQISYLELNERPLTIDQEGEILETYGATRFGYFAFRRLADVTPREYRPEGQEEFLPIASP